ncbi:MAG: diguanylate cyclase [Hydrococcus sp. C42_A2020_068]|uniref:GGDEF domain-containing response regulator n=1 Tax=Pleurocapsa sp. PCC 7327 TaxID=118163 RepID=UPI00029FAAB1|nr:diguanylate cyclase [Pleurocapsa sp. PCC 7327]AFY79623.1 diguanylate cyclase (GGDEF) domain-containing protein [Pleurocapsa sp. PCC 7327]MBF2021198.1 diguanylate cyclase [Hydrococcus sp. C42_A2020_068]
MKAFNPQDFHILIVDGTSDNDNLQPTIARLAATGYDISFVANEQEALEAIKQLQPDLILFNLTKQDANPLEIGKTLHAHSEYARIPKLFLTANREQEALLETLDSGMVDSLSQPSNELEVLACIRTHLKLKRNWDELQKAYSELEKLVNTDPLTGVANRRALLAFGEREFNRAKRYAHPFSVLAIDIDRFKQINDTYGHDIGDRVLIAMSRSITQYLRQVDCFGRFGGEEFLVFLPETEELQATKVAERIRKRIAKNSLQVAEQTVTITISIGIATYQPGDGTLDAIIKRADRSLYSAKEQGRNRVGISVPVVSSSCSCQSKSELRSIS